MKLKEVRRIVQVRGNTNYGQDLAAQTDEALNAGMEWADEIISNAGTGLGLVPVPLSLEASRDTYQVAGFGRIAIVERQIANGAWQSYNYFPAVAGSYLESRNAPGGWWTLVGESAIRLWPTPESGGAGLLRVWGYPAHRIDPKGNADSTVLFPPHAKQCVLWYASLELATNQMSITKCEKALARAELTFRKYVEIPQSGPAPGMMKEAR